MKTQLTIPPQINVGFQNRSDTYTGKLAYVVYTDSKGVMRKESSWQNWRDKTIPPLVFNNIPTSGFVLNKKVGDYSSRWGGRRASTRVYDPRDFEFEISVDNLLFILEETSAIKGKGLEGEFVYAWDGKDLVLLPASSQENKASTAFCELQTQKVTKKEMKEGFVYLDKKEQQVMYLGRLDYYEIVENSADNIRRKRIKCNKKHIFVSVDGKSNYSVRTGFTDIAKRLSDDVSPLYANEFDIYKKSKNGSRPVELVGVLQKKQPGSYYNGSYYNLRFVKSNNDYYAIFYDYNSRSYP